MKITIKIRDICLDFEPVSKSITLSLLNQKLYQTWSNDQCCIVNNITTEQTQWRFFLFTNSIRIFEQFPNVIIQSSPLKLVTSSGYVKLLSNLAEENCGLREFSRNRIPTGNLVVNQMPKIVAVSVLQNLSR